ncbi:ubiquitin carboxyl-terminal hydrolase 32 isoform X2 [Hydra vulgaris]|uniref:ubiquitinyl hydrolase 1 n=1 Tax=Hydra vulgaris TaxID=6087 RepID=A0ABM4B7T6_HYDVU
MIMTFQTEEDAIFKNTALNQSQQLEQTIKLDQISTNIHSNAGIANICGLSNLGNTCFINASLQCLLGTQPLKKIIMQTDFQIKLEFMKQLQDIFVKVESGKYLVLHLKAFHQVLSKLHPVFGNFKQHDSQEFLSFVLNSIHDELKKSNITSEQSEEKISSTTDWITNGVAKRLKMDKVLLEPGQEVNSKSLQSVDEHAWSHYLVNNESVISTTMQGQFQSIVSCDKCAFVSHTYEPFMFLSLPIPYAMERDIVLTWVPSIELLILQGKPSIKRYSVLVNKDGSLKDVKDKFLKMLTTDDSSIISQNVVLAQVVNGGNVNILDERTLLSYVNFKKDLYAIEVVQPSGCIKYLDCDNVTNESLGKPDTKSEVALSWHVCSICLEEVFDEHLTIHPPCGGMMCSSCLEATVQYYQNETFACPICNHQIVSNDYKQFVEPGSNDAINRKVLVPVLFRRKSDNMKLELFGHPTIFSLYSQTDSNFIGNLVQSVVLSLNSSSNFDIVITDAAGIRCGLCEHRDTCTGCLISDSVKLKPGNCLTIHFNHGNIDQIVQMDKSMSHHRNLNFVTLDECVAKFSEIEHLTCDCAWYCPQCKCNQPAAKRMTVSRWPHVLIVHLKRFHYKDGKGCKLQSLIDFPLSKFMPSVLCTNKTEKSLCPEYELYACICHSGTLNEGHYTSFVKHEDKWYYFNDDIYTQLEPSESNRDGVYVLFYKKAGFN